MIRLGSPMGAIAALALAGGLAVAAWDWRDARADRATLRVCAAAAGDAAKPTDGCPEEVAAAIEVARRAAACDVAIGAGDLFAERTNCTANVKRRLAQLVAARASLASAEADLARARATATAAARRAEARGVAQSQRSAHAQDAIRRAPRGADGLIVCDAQCLRDLAGDRPGG